MKQQVNTYLVFGLFGERFSERVLPVKISAVLATLLMYSFPVSME